MEFDGWFVEMSTHSAAKKEPHFHVVLDKIQGLHPDEKENSSTNSQPVLPDIWSGDQLLKRKLAEGLTRRKKREREGQTFRNVIMQ